VNPPDRPQSALRLSPRFDEAVAYALNHHRDHHRKGTRIPYAAHLLAVTAIVLEMEASEDEAIAAVLHDVIEDGGGPSAELKIAESWGPEVAAMVRANSDADVTPKPPWKQRKQAYIGGIPTKPISAIRVSIADKLHNATAIVADFDRHGEAVWKRFSAAPDEILRYYRGLVAAFEARRPELGEGASLALDRLGLAVEEVAARVEGVSA
jgi:(p)ppGpp synthase/HD superfamily hydrolase